MEGCFESNPDCVLTGVGVVPCQGKSYRKETRDRLAMKIFKRAKAGNHIPWVHLSGKVELFTEWAKAGRGYE